MFVLDLSRQPEEQEAKSPLGTLPSSRRDDGLVVTVLGSLVALGKPFGFSVSHLGWEEHTVFVPSYRHDLFRWFLLEKNRRYFTNRTPLCAGS